MKRARLILNIMALLLVVFQVVGYIGAAGTGQQMNDAEGINQAAFYVGFNLPLITAVILFLIAQNLKRKINKKEASDNIDSIGNN